MRFYQTNPTQKNMDHPVQRIMPNWAISVRSLSGGTDPGAPGGHRSLRVPSLGFFAPLPKLTL